MNEPPEITLCGRFFHKADDFNVKYNCDINVLHIYEYSGIMRIDSEQICFCPGDITITPIGTTSTYKFAKSGMHHCIHFKANKSKNDMFPLELHIPSEYIEPSASDNIKKAIETLNCPASSCQKKINASLSSAMLLQSLLMLNSKASQTHVNTDKIADFLSLIDSRLTENLTIPQLAAEIGLSQNYLASMFKKRMNMTIKQYILTRKMARAKYLLSSTQMQVKAIANEIGIDDNQYFNRKFTQTVGVSPLRFRQNSIQNKK
ncbi:MAG: helix-turn-helix transcriptional regulator [Sedimentisphaeraceae bacterium JB056]